MRNFGRSKEDQLALLMQRNVEEDYSKMCLQMQLYSDYYEVRQAPSMHRLARRRDHRFGYGIATVAKARIRQVRGGAAAIV